MADEQMQIVYKDIDEIIPYEKNPRDNEAAVEPVMESIKEFGFKVPVVLSSDNVVIAGHTRIKAARMLGITDIPCIMADDLTDEQVAAFRLADNKTTEFAMWDEDLLAEELNNINNIDMSLFGFDDYDYEMESGNDDTYTSTVKIPQYEITGECPTIDQMVDTEKADELIQEINESSVSEDEKYFLTLAAKRHDVFNYRNIAEYYAHAEPEMQRLMEKSALVIIDVNDAIANGYANLVADIEEAMGDEA